MRKTDRNGSRRLGRLAVLVLAGVVALGGGIVTSGEAASASPASGFQAGNIISDGIFFNGSQMSAAEVQTFLNGRVPKCQIGTGSGQYRPGAPWGNTTIANNCLRDYRMNTASKSSNAYCGAYAGKNNETAAQIIARVGAACNIGQRVLLVLLEKEQSLVTDTFPTTIQYRSATGYGCPDTAPCDSEYYGFFNQVYRAAWTFNYYRKHQSSFNYQSGKTNRIYWHPNTGCGTSNVFIENDATAGLYIYTPYRPNQAALNAGFGTGDACSSYGNRNFYLIYKTWFGDPTQQSVLAKADGNAAVYLIAGGKKYHIEAPAYSQYLSAFGPRATVSQATLNALPNGPKASFYVKNSSNGQVAFLDGGKTHRFGSCGLVSDWGGACGESLVVLPNDLFAKFGAGPEMTPYAKRSGSTAIHRITRGTITPYYDAAVAKRENGGSAPYTATLPDAAAQAKTVARTAFDPDTFVRVSGKPEVLIAMRDGKLAHLTSWNAAAELGLPSSVQRVVAASALREYQPGPVLGQWVSCGGKSYLGAGGKLTQVQDTVAAAFAPAVLDSATCAALKKSTSPVSPNLFVKATGAPEVYLVENGQRRHVTSKALLVELAGSAQPAIVSMRQASVDAIPAGAPVLREGTFVRATGAKEVYLVAGSSRMHLPHWDIARAYGFSTDVTVLPADTIAALPEADAPLGLFATCSGTTVFANGGAVIRLSSELLRADNPSADLSAVACGRLKMAAGTRSQPLFVTDGVRTAAPVLGGFLRYENAAQVELAAAGSEFKPLTVTAAVLDQLPQPTRLPAEGTLARSAANSDVVLISRSERVRLPNWGLANDLGISTPYEVFQAPALGHIAPSAGAELGPIVQCGPTLAVAGSGVLTPVTAEAVGNLPVISLAEATCGRLKFGVSDPVREVLLQPTTGGDSYLLRGGQLTRGVPGPGSPVVRMDQRTLGLLTALSG